jgi:hypothetical protein
MLNTLTRRQLIVQLKELEKIDNLIEKIKDKTTDDEYSIVLVSENHHSFMQGKSDEICNIMFNMIEELIKATGLNFDVILREIIEKRKKQ